MSLAGLIDASLSPDQSVRTQAEQSLSTQVSPQQLAEFVKTSTDNAQRLAALVYLKNYILHHWTNQFGEFREPACPEDQKSVLRHECFHFVGDAVRAVRLQAGFIVSKMITADYPDEWATVLDDLMGILAKPPSQDWLHGALVVMKDFVEDSMSEEQFLPVAQNLVQYLLVITRNPEFPASIRAEAINVFMSCLDSLEMLTSTRKEGIRVFVDQALPPWLEILVSIINSPTSDIELKSRTIETIIKLRLLFPSQLVQYLPAIFQPVYESLRTTDIYDNDNIKSTELQIEFIRKAIQAKIIVEEQLSQRAIFEGVVALALRYAQITPVQGDDWSADMDGFVEDLEDTAVNSRHLCTDILEDLQKINPTWTKEILEAAIMHYFVQANPSEHLTREQESLVFTLSILTENTPQLQKVLEVALSSSDHYLLGRGAIYAAQLGIADCFEACCKCIMSQDVIIRLCAIKAIAKYADTQADLVKQNQARILEAIVSGSQGVPASALLMVAESLAPIIHLEPSIVLSQNSPLPGLFTLLAGNPGDISLVSTVVDIFETLASSVDFAALCNAVLPVLFNTISSEPALRSIAFDILNGIIEGSDHDLPEGFVDTIWPAFKIEMEVEEAQTVHEILRNLVKKSWLQIVNGQHVDDLLNIIGTAFTDEDESHSFYVPQLVISLIRQSGNLLADIMPKLLQIIVQKLKTQGLSTAYQQNLISVFAEIAISQAKPLLDFLIQQEGLKIVLRTWSEVFSDFHGYATIRTSVVGLSQIYASMHPALATIELKGDLIPDTSGKILTRSRAKSNPDRYTMIPVPAKIIKLFHAELVNDMEGRTEDEEEMVSDDEWDSSDLHKVIEEAQLNESEYSRLTEESSDPLKEVNTRQYILDFFRAQLASGQAAMVTSVLTQDEQTSLQAALNS